MSDLDPSMLSNERLTQMLRQRRDALRLLGILVERLGGEVTILPDELVYDRNISRDDIGFTGAIRLRSERV